MSKKKKIIVMSSLVFLLALTAVLNVLLAHNRTTASGDSAVAVSNYFATYRSERATTRNEELLQLDSIIAMNEEGSDKYNEAMNLKLQLIEMMDDELQYETMIKALGIADAVVSIGKDTENINVFINSNELDMDTALSIYNMLREEAGVEYNKIIIVPVYSQI